MLNTKNIIVDINLIPSTWVFEYYLNTEKLQGQRVRIKSVWNTDERTPSMYLFVHNKQKEYYFKDFSSGNYGNKIDLVMLLYNIDYYQAINKIINDFKGEPKFESINQIEETKFEIKEIEFRSLNSKDILFWNQFNIDKNLLIEYNIKPIFTLSIQKNRLIKIANDYMYAYSDLSNNVYKIYQPFNKEFKFFNIKSYISGIENLKYTDNLIICSSLKDCLSLKSLYNFDVIAPESETTIIKEYIINNLKEKYKTILTLFDNDNPGNMCKKKYYNLYNIDGIILPLAKDISDSIKIHGIQEVKNHLNKLHEIFYTG